MEPAKQPPPAQPPQLPSLQVRYCGIHGLVLGPDGRCTICKRNAAEPTQEGNGRTLTAVLVLAAVCGGALHLQGRLGHAEAGREPIRAPVVIAPAAAQPLSVVNDPGYIEEEQAKGEAAAAHSLEKQRDLEEAEHKVTVRVYTTAACDLCRTATAYLKEKGLAYTELDVDKDEAAAAALRKLRPQPMVPTFEVDGEVVVGFGPREMGAASPARPSAASASLASGDAHRAAALVDEAVGDVDEEISVTRLLRTVTFVSSGRARTSRRARRRASPRGCRRQGRC